MHVIHTYIHTLPTTACTAHINQGALLSLTLTLLLVDMAEASYLESQGW